MCEAPLMSSALKYTFVASRPRPPAAPENSVVIGPPSTGMRWTPSESVQKSVLVDWSTAISAGGSLGGLGRVTMVVAGPPVSGTRSMAGGDGYLSTPKYPNQSLV